jgi:hypothetical protein
MAVNLNELRILVENSAWQNLSDNGAVSTDGGVTVHFRNLEEHLLGHIRRSQIVVGCVAWLTSDTILRALASVPIGVSIVVQKEDFLRPDIGSASNWKAELRQRYGRLKELPERHLLGGLVGSLSVCTDPTIQPVRCVGNHNRDKKTAFPRMHNKFLVFCDVTELQEGGYSGVEIRPQTVWTGSFNLTKNATMSLENALVLSDPSIVRAYFCEWEQVLALSEQLDWESDWCEPEWRVGT